MITGSACCAAVLIPNLIPPVAGTTSVSRPQTCSPRQRNVQPRAAPDHAVTTTGRAVAAPAVAHGSVARVLGQELAFTHARAPAASRLWRRAVTMGRTTHQRGRAALWLTVGLLAADGLALQLRLKKSDKVGACGPGGGVRTAARLPPSIWRLCGLRLTS